ncbi:MAG TPA: iron-containing alcohol dehydrogenase [Eubacteriaceae bacterium]|nr:iron-containing alcohol dehydrogenase [Eubacteriaceae bacterium]
MNNLTLPFSFTLPTKIVYGPGCIFNLIEELKVNNGKRPIIVTDKGIREAGLLDRITSILDNNKVKYIIYDGVEPNPKDVNVEEGAKIAKEFGADSIISIGGGSPIDCGKSIGVLLSHNEDKIKKYEGKTAATKHLPLLIAIPTTAGTGSELTFSSVITDTKNNYKMTIKSPYTAPKVALCDPELTLTLPAHITASTGMDALTHAIEAYTANCSEPISDGLALYAIELIYNNLVLAFNEGQNLEARSGMLLGSMMAGIAFSHSDVASVHCIAESLGGVYDLPHGVCNAIFLPHVMEYNMNYAVEKYGRIGKAMGLDFEDIKEGAQKAVNGVKSLAIDVELPIFSDLEVNINDFERLAEMATRNISTQSNPRPMNKDDYLTILKRAYY